MTKNIKSRKKLTKVFQFFAAYLVAAWTFLQFLDWIFNRYQLSPHWIDMCLWVFIGIIPSLLIYLYHQNRINKRILHLREKIIFPLNIILLFAFLLMNFNSKDLSAKTKEISFITAAGNLEHLTILKDKYRIGIPFFNFENKTKDSSMAWVGDAIPNLLFYDLKQDKNVNTAVHRASNTSAKVSLTKIFYKYYVDGTYEVQDSIYTLTPALRTSKNGKLVASKSFKNNDLLQLLDSVSIYVREHAGITEDRRDKYVDLRLEEFLSSDLEAIKYAFRFKQVRTHKLVDAYKALELDSTFALLYFELGKGILNFNISLSESKYLIDKALQFGDRLPLDKYYEVMQYKYMANKEWLKAEQYAKLQLEIYPKNEGLLSALFTIYSESKRMEDYYQLAKEYYKNEPITDFHNLNRARLVVGKFDESINTLKKLIKLDPDSNVFPQYLLKSQLLNGNMEEARKILDELNVLRPDWNNYTKVFEFPIAYQNNHKISDKDLSVFEGEYAAHEYELISTYWINNGILLLSSSNQRSGPVIVAGPLKLIAGFAGSRTGMNDFIQDENGRIYLRRGEANYKKNTLINYSWKLDESIKKAEMLFKEDNMEAAEDAYKIAIVANPNHFYLKDALKHIQYVKNTDSDSLKAQYESVVGQYGKNKISMKNGKLYTNFRWGIRWELIPISKTRYMIHAIPGYQFEFEFENGGPPKIINWHFKVEDMVWKKF